MGRLTRQHEGHQSMGWTEGRWRSPGKIYEIVLELNVNLPINLGTANVYTSTRSHTSRQGRGT